MRSYEERKCRIEHLAQQGIETDELSACGISLLATRNLRPSHLIVRQALHSLKIMAHRGASGADPASSDGVGIMCSIPWGFFDLRVGISLEDFKNRRGLGVLFLPGGSWGQLLRSRISQSMLKLGVEKTIWRRVPVCSDVLGNYAKSTQPDIYHLILLGAKATDRRELSQKIESEMLAINHDRAYLASYSTDSMVYKGLMANDQLGPYYSDLRDENFEVLFALSHTRFSTNTLPAWRSAQPFHSLAHNGEFNTLKGNRIWMKSRFHQVADDSILMDANQPHWPSLSDKDSDSSSFDKVFTCLADHHQDLDVVKRQLVPSKDDERAEGIDLEPWDGPAAVIAYRQGKLIAFCDRNGLRPLRYGIGKEFLYIGSETGMMQIRDEEFSEKGQIGAGESLGFSFLTGEVHSSQNGALSTKMTSKGSAKYIHSAGFAKYQREPVTRKRCVLAGVFREYSEDILLPMATTGQEPVGSMGDDTPPAFLSESWFGLNHFLRQKFSQVTNPPMDSLREQQVMTLHTKLRARQKLLASPLQYHRLVENKSRVMIDATYSRDKGIQARLQQIEAQLDRTVRPRVEICVTDKAADWNCPPVPVHLIVSALHQMLVERGLRHLCDLRVESDEIVTTHDYAMVIACGATTVRPGLALDIIAESENDVDPKRYFAALDKGLLKIMSKLGISVVSSYRGSRLFEIVGLSDALRHKYFPGVSGSYSVVDFAEMEERISALIADEESADEDRLLPVSGLDKIRKGGEHHSYSGNFVHTMQTACNTGDRKIWQKAVSVLTKGPLFKPSDCVDFRKADAPIDLAEVEGWEDIVKSLLTPGMSLGALSHEAHSTLNIAMNRLNVRSVSGEGGEKRSEIAELNSRTKQVASGRFGVTAEYLRECDEIEIKIAQGAKPGEGGQLPGHKVTAEIAFLRHSTPGTTLISPPPHHDIYSIEDLAQLIFDLKRTNHLARVCVKLVSTHGVGTIALGVAKAGADVISISGNAGGTGASPKTSLRHVGLPWEVGLKETHVMLEAHGLREDVLLRVDGGFKTGADIVKAALLGAQEFALGTAPLVAMGCLIVRQCHSNVCPVGICTQRPELRSLFTGTPEKVQQLFQFVAEDIRDILASMGFSKLTEITGRSDLLQPKAGLSKKWQSVVATLTQLDTEAVAKPSDWRKSPQHVGLDEDVFDDVKTHQWSGTSRHLVLQRRIDPSVRSFGARLSSLIRPIPVDSRPRVEVQFNGHAGQSFGAFSGSDLKLVVTGDANDYVGKGLSGASLVIKPIEEHQNTSVSLLGNTALYGATSGSLFVAGRAGERFAVRNSGATAVIEGCGSNGCEYMTGGTVVILGKVGSNFGAGYSGGKIYVLDADAGLGSLLNQESAVEAKLSKADEQELKHLLRRHLRETGSVKAHKLLDTWSLSKSNFVKVIPVERHSLQQIKSLVTPGDPRLLQNGVVL